MTQCLKTCLTGQKSGLKKQNRIYANQGVATVTSFLLPKKNSRSIDMHIKLWYDYSYQSYKGEANMNILDGKYAWMVKIGEKGQFVIPKEARELFDFQPGDEILVLGDIERGIAILPKAKQQDTIKQVFCEIEE